MGPISRATGFASAFARMGPRTGRATGVRPCNRIRPQGTARVVSKTRLSPCPVPLPVPWNYCNSFPTGDGGEGFPPLRRQAPSPYSPLALNSRSTPRLTSWGSIIFMHAAMPSTGILQRAWSCGFRHQAAHPAAPARPMGVARQLADAVERLLVGVLDPLHGNLAPADREIRLPPRRHEVHQLGVRPDAREGMVRQHDELAAGRLVHQAQHVFKRRVIVARFADLHESDALVKGVHHGLVYPLAMPCR